MALPLAALGALAQAPQLALGAYQTIQGYRGLRKLQRDPYPEYSISPELQEAYARAQTTARQGYDPTERAAFGQQLARSAATSFRQATDIAGGGLAGTIARGISAEQAAPIAQFEAAGARLKREAGRDVTSIARALQSQRNLATGSKLQRRMQLEQAYGLGAQTGVSNITQALGGIGAIGLQAERLKQLGEIAKGTKPQLPGERTMGAVPTYEEQIGFEAAPAADIAYQGLLEEELPTVPQTITMPPAIAGM